MIRFSKCNFTKNDFIDPKMFENVNFKYVQGRSSVLSLLLLRFFSFSVVLLVGLEALVQLHDGGLDEVVAEEAVVVEEVGARLGEGGLAPLLGLTVLEHQAQLVDVVKPGGGGGNKKIININ